MVINWTLMNLSSNRGDGGPGKRAPSTLSHRAPAQDHQASLTARLGIYCAGCDNGVTWYVTGGGGVDPEIAALAGSAGTTVVTLMATDAWQRVREGVVGLWRRAYPDRAEAVGAELDSTRADLMAARAAGDTRSEEELHGEWQGRLRRLMTAEPSVVDDLRLILDEFNSLTVDPSVPAQPILMRASASGHGRVYQAGRDQHITET